MSHPQNCNVICTNSHSVQKIKFYNEYNQELIHNPLAEWHWLNKCILQLGSIGPEESCGDNEDHDVTNNVTNEAYEVKVDRVWTECRRQNKQRRKFDCDFFTVCNFFEQDLFLQFVIFLPIWFFAFQALTGRTTRDNGPVTVWQKWNKRSKFVA